MTSPSRIDAAVPPAPAVPPGALASALWRLAYAITGDRGVAGRVVLDAWDKVASGRVAPGRLRGEVVALARAHVARAGGRAAAHHDRLWSALRPLPRRVRADIVQRLVEDRSAR